MPDHPEWVRTVVSSIAGLSSPTVFCDAGRFMDSAHQRRAEVKLKKRQGALEAEAGVSLLLLRGPTCPLRLKTRDE